MQKFAITCAAASCTRRSRVRCLVVGACEIGGNSSRLIIVDTDMEIAADKVACIWEAVWFS